MLRRMCLITLFLVSIVSAQGIQGIRVGGGPSFSKWAGSAFEDGVEVEYLQGLRLGVEKILANGMIVCLSFSSRNIHHHAGAMIASGL